MISVLPLDMTDGSSLKDKHDVVFMVRESKTELGCFGLDRTEKGLWLSEFRPGKDLLEMGKNERKPVLELILRTAAAYGERRGIALLLCEEPFFCETAEELGFQQNDKIFSISVEKMLHKCKNC